MRASAAWRSFLSRFSPAIEEFVADAVFVVHVQQLAFLLFDLGEDALAAVDPAGCR